LDRQQCLLDQFVNLLPSVRAVSFDVFDTLFVRVLDTPEGLFSLMANSLGESDFPRRRREAQAMGFKRMAREGRREITLDDIYEHLPSKAGKGMSVAELEQVFENRVIRVNPEIVQLFREARRQGKVLAFTSDMYLPQSFFEQLASRHGLEPDHFVISSTCNATKRDSGELFDVLQRTLALDAADILHVGDNPLGDVRRAKEKGLQTMHYVAPDGTSLIPAADRPAAQLCAGVSRYARYDDTTSPWFRLGWQYGGPLLHGFVPWIQEQARKDGIDCILFVSRDGFVLRELHHRTSPSDLPSAYLRGSRVSFSLAAMSETNFIEHLPFLLSGADQVTVDNLFQRIGVELPDERVLTDLGLSAGLRITDETRPQAMQLLILMRQRILQVAREARRGLHLHLIELGLGDGMRVAFIDVGWSGTTQEAFERAIEGLVQLDVRGYYLALSGASETLRRSSGMSLTAFSESVLLSAEERRQLYANRAVAELFFSAPHPTTVGYRVGGGELQFVVDEERGVDYDIASIVTDINDGITSYVEDADKLHQQFGLPAERRFALENLLQLLTSPTVEQVRLIGQIYNWDAWASTERYRIYFAGQPPESEVPLQYKPDLWPAGWSLIRRVILGGGPSV